MLDSHHEVDEAYSATRAYASGVGLPQVEDWEREEVLDEICGIYDAHPVLSGSDDIPLHEQPHVNAIFDVVPLVELMLKTPPEQIPFFRIADLAVMCAYPSLSESVAVQIAFGREVGVEQRSALLSLLTEAKINEMSPDDYIAGLHSRGELGHNHVSRCFRGEEAEAPTAERIRRGIPLIRRALALLPVYFRVGPLCTLAWLHWANGKRAIAMQYLHEAQRIEPDHVIVCGLALHFGTRMPAWVDARERSVT